MTEARGHQFPFRSRARKGPYHLFAGVMTIVALILTAGCGSSGAVADRPAVSSISQRGALTVEVSPNPIEARLVSGDTYDFPFRITIRETGGLPVEITRVRFEVLAFGALRVYEQSFGPDEITRRGYPTSVAARGELLYEFSPRKEVTDSRLFGGVSAELTIEGTDGAGNSLTARETVTVRR